MPNEAPTIQISPTETLKAVVDKGKLGFVHTLMDEGTYAFEGGAMREKTKPVFRTSILQGIIPAEVYRTRPDEVLAFTKETIKLLQGNDGVVEPKPPVS